MLCQFLKPSAMSSGPVEEVDFRSKYNLKDDKDLLIREAPHDFIAEYTKNGLRENHVKEFFSDVKSYFKTVCGFLIEKHPIKEVLKHAEVADATPQQSENGSDLAFFLQGFPALLPPGCSVDAVVKQFAMYQCADITSCFGEIEDTHLTLVANIQQKNSEN